MGWWNAPENPDLTVGDAVLDLTRRFLVDFSREYQEDLSRKPTVQELEYALNLAFKVNLDDEIVSGFEELEVKQVTIKTSKRSKRQKAKPGDIFGKSEPVSAAEAKTYPSYSARGDRNVKDDIVACLAGKPI